MKILPAAAVALLLAGCATAPRPQDIPVHHIARPAAAPVALPAENPATFKQRWYDRFRVHPSKWFHRR